MSVAPTPLPLPELVEEVELPGAHIILTAGAEFTAQERYGSRRRRVRFTAARRTPKGWELTGWDGHRVRTFRAEQVVELHLDRGVPDSPEAFRAPDRPRGRR